MMTFYHGSPELFDRFDLNKVGAGTGIKFGFGVYLTESEASAVHYSQPRHQPIATHHYLYTVEIPDLTDDNHLVSANPVPAAIVQRAEAKLGKPIPHDKTLKGKEFRKWLGLTLTGNKKVDVESERAAAEFLDSIGVFGIVWPQAQTKPDGLKNCAVFNADNVHIVKIESIGVELKEKKYVLVENSKQIVIDRMKTNKVLGTGNFALDIIYKRRYPEGFDTTRKRNPFVDDLIIEEVGNTCGNVMCMLPYLEVETYPIGHFDESEQGLKMTADLKRYGANTRFVKNSPAGGTTLMTCIHKLDRDGQHMMSHRATAPNSRFPRRKQLRKDEVSVFLAQLDFTPDVYFFDVSDAGPRELAKALKERGVMVYYEPEGNREMNKFLKCVEVSDIVKFSGANILDVSFVDNYSYSDKLFIRTMGEEGMEFNLQGQGWKKIAPVPNPNVVDWEGAGDWTTAVFIAELCKSGKRAIADLTEADVRGFLENAAAVASRSVSYMGSKGLIHDRI